MSTCGIYLITGLAYKPTDAGDNGYFGLSTNIENRSGQHFSALQKGKHPNEHLQNYANKHGVENLQMNIILKCKPDELPIYEKEFIANSKTYLNPKGFNKTPGGDGVAPEVNALPYHFRNAKTGEEEKGENLNEFCKLHPDLNRDCMYRVKNGKQKLHQGWYSPEHCSDDQAQALLEPYKRKDVEEGLAKQEDVSAEEKGNQENPK